MRVLPEGQYRWNFIVMGLDYSLFLLGLSFISVYSVMPLFVHHLTSSNLALGFISAVRSAGFLIPPILIAGYTERLHRTKPFLLAATTMERLPYLVLALAIPLLAADHPTLLLWLFFAMVGTGSLFGGLGTGAWVDLLARMLPGDWRGRFFGLSAALGGLLGVAGGAGAAEILHRFSWPTSFTICFACCFACLVVSFVFIALGREPLPKPVAPPRSQAYWRGLPGLVRADRNFGFYLLATVFITMSGMAASFYTVDAEKSLRLTDAGAGVYAIPLLVASTIGNVLWGYVGDHYGHKRTVEGGVLLTGLAALLALGSHDPHWGVLAYGGVFVLTGLGSSAVQLAALTFVIDFAPPEQRPTYIGLATVVGAPFAFGAPLIGGAIADQAGYTSVFVLSLLLALIGVALVLFRVRDPRIAARRANLAAR